MTTEQQLKYLRKILRITKAEVKILAKYFSASQDALALEKKGHTPDWDNVQRLADEIEDSLDVDAIASE